MKKIFSVILIMLQLLTISVLAASAELTEEQKKRFTAAWHHDRRSGWQFAAV